MATESQRAELVLAAGEVADRCRDADVAYRKTMESNPLNVDDVKIWSVFAGDVQQALGRFSAALAAARD
jgi:hypothetical protein